MKVFPLKGQVAINIRHPVCKSSTLWISFYKKNLSGGEFSHQPSPVAPQYAPL